MKVCNHSAPAVAALLYIDIHFGSRSAVTFRSCYLRSRACACAPGCALANIKKKNIFQTANITSASKMFLSILEAKSACRKHTIVI